MPRSVNTVIGVPMGSSRAKRVADVDENHRDVDLGNDCRQVKQQWLREMVAVQHGQPIADRIDPNCEQHQVQKRTRRPSPRPATPARAADWRINAGVRSPTRGLPGTAKTTRAPPKQPPRPAPPAAR